MLGYGRGPGALERKKKWGRSWWGQKIEVNLNRIILRLEIEDPWRNPEGTLKTYTKTHLKIFKEKTENARNWKKLKIAGIFNIKFKIPGREIIEVEN